jgi:hypothetical protein
VNALGRHRMAARRDMAEGFGMAECRQERQGGSPRTRPWLRRSRDWPGGGLAACL